MRLPHLILMPAVSAALLLSLASCSFTVTNNADNGRATPAPNSSSAATSSAPTASTSVDPGTIDHSTAKGVAQAWLDALVRQDVVTMADLGTTGTAGDLAGFQKAAEVANPTSPISNVRITGQSKSFFNSDDQTAVQINFTYTEQGKNQKGALNLFQNKDSKDWKVFESPLVGPSLTFDSSAPKGATKTYALANGKKFLLYATNADGSIHNDPNSRNLLPGTYKIEQDGPGTKIVTRTETYELSNSSIGTNAN